jgi:hypothetical protein
MAETGITITVDGKEESLLSLAFQGRLKEVIGEKQAALERAFPRAMAKGVVTPGKEKLRAAVSQSGVYRAASLARAAWYGGLQPTSAPTLEPAAFFSTRRGMQTIVQALEDGATITVKNARYLAVPEGPAKAIIHALNRGRTSDGALHNEANPVERVAQALGVSLIPIIDEARGVGVLVADDLSALTKGGRRRKSQRAAPTPLFALVRQATLKSRPMGRAVLAQLSASFQADFAGALAGELGPDD